MTHINLNDRSVWPLLSVAGSAEVYTRATWAAAWTLRPDLYAVQTVWTMAPSVATATLEYRYGRVMVPGASRFTDLLPITARGYFVCIRRRNPAGVPIDWVGYAELPITRDRTQARDGLPQSGKQTIPCFGLLRALEHTIVDSTVYAHPDRANEALRSGGTGAIFNEGMRGNRSKTKRSLAGAGPAAFVFAHPNDEDSTFWSTRDIVEHLAAFHLPTPMSAPVSGGLPWSVNNLDVLPIWDRPSIPSDLSPVSELLNQLIRPEKMLSYTIGASIGGAGVPVVNSLVIEPRSLLASPLSLPLATVPANPDQFSLSWTNDPLTEVVVDQDATAVYDQVIVQGPREIAVCTLSADPAATSTHEQGWETADQSQYSDGAILWSGFSAASIEEKRTTNERFRTQGKMRNVYSLYKFRKDFNGRNQNQFLFEPVSGQPYIPSPLGIEILDYLPLYEEVNYGADPATVDETRGLTLRKPVFSLRERNPDGSLSATRLYIDPEGRLTDQDALLQSRPFRLEYEFEDFLNVRLVVRDAPQHAIAGKEFVGNLGDLDQETVFGDLSHKGWELTIAIRGDRRPRFALPAPEAIAGLDVVRRKIITLDDDSLASIYIGTNTIVGFANNTPNTVTSPGGVLRNPTPILESICRLVARQYTEPRQRVTIRTARLLPQLSVGALITTVETATTQVNTIISEMRVDSPLTETMGPPTAPTQTFTVSPFRSDVLSLLRNQMGGVSSRSTGRRKKRQVKPISQRRPLVPRAERIGRR